jgi:NAD(P)-dependent dehydrogenase (short-subunit alcohol dehydrogenase family)
MPSALVTGASTGIGRATALRLDAAGWRVFAGVRREADADLMRDAGSERLAPLILDVTDAGQIEAAAEEIASLTGSDGLEGLVNNAGISLPSPLETIPIEDFRRQVEVNLTGQVAVTQAMLPAIRAARGRVVFVSSIGGLIAFPMTGAYHAAKFGIEAVGDVFRRELRGWGISVSIVEPGSIATEIWDRGEAAADEIAGRSPQHEALYGKAIERYRKTVEGVAGRGIPPDRAARTIERALTARRPRARYLIGTDAKLQARVRHLIPIRVFDRVLARATGV